MFNKILKNINDLLENKKYIEIHQIMGVDEFGLLVQKPDLDKLKKLDDLKPDPKNPGKN